MSCSVDQLLVDELLVDHLLVDQLHVDQLLVDQLLVEELLVDELLVDPLLGIRCSWITCSWIGLLVDRVARESVAPWISCSVDQKGWPVTHAAGVFNPATPAGSAVSKHLFSFFCA